MKPPAFQFYPDDFVAGVADLTQAEVGAYILLLCRQWGSSAIPSDNERREIVAKGPVTDYVLAKFTQGADGERRNVRMEVERIKQAEFREKKTESGKRGADSRWQTHGSAIRLPLANGMANGVANDSSPSPSPSPSPKRLYVANGEPEPAEATTPTRSSSKRFAREKETEKELMGRLREVLGEDEMARCGGHWRSNHVRVHPDLLRRALDEVERMVKASEIGSNPAAALTDLVKRWKC